MAEEVKQVIDLYGLLVHEDVTLHRAENVTDNHAIFPILKGKVLLDDYDIEDCKERVSPFFVFETNWINEFEDDFLRTRKDYYVVVDIRLRPKEGGRIGWSGNLFGLLHPELFACYPNDHKIVWYECVSKWYKGAPPESFCQEPGVNGLWCTRCHGTPEWPRDLTQLMFCENGDLMLYQIPKSAIIDISLKTNIDGPELLNEYQDINEELSYQVYELLTLGQKITDFEKQKQEEKEALEKQQKDLMVRTGDLTVVHKRLDRINAQIAEQKKANIIKKYEETTADQRKILDSLKLKMDALRIEIAHEQEQLQEIERAKQRELKVIGK